MARRARHSLKGAIYHVMLRGNNKQAIFFSENEREKFSLLIQEGIERFGYRVLAFCFMTNHVHLAIELGEVSLSKICQNLSFRYTKYYNTKNDTTGHLFQGRFKSILVVGTKYLRQLIRYIHLNPVRANLVADPSDYIWSSHQTYLGGDKFPWVAKDRGLELFGKDDIAVKEYAVFVSEGIGVSEEVDFKVGIAKGIVSDSLESDRKEHLEVNSKEASYNLGVFIQEIANWYQIPSGLAAFLGKDRRASHLREITAYLAKTTNKITIKELALLWNRADNSISQAVSRFESKLLKSDRLKKECGALKETVLSNLNLK